MICFWTWKITPFPFWVQPHHQIWTVGLAVKVRIPLRPPVQRFNLMAGSGMAAAHPGEGPLGHLCSHMSALYPFLLLMQTVEVMTVWLMISPLTVLEWLTVKIILTSAAESPDFNDCSLQLALPASHAHRGKGECNATQEVICESVRRPPSHQYSSWLKVYSYRVKDDCTVRLRNESWGMSRFPIYP